MVYVYVHFHSAVAKYAPVAANKFILGIYLDFVVIFLYSNLFTS